MDFPARLSLGIKSFPKAEIAGTVVDSVIGAVIEREVASLVGVRAAKVFQGFRAICGLLRKSKMVFYCSRDVLLSFHIAQNGLN